MTQSEVAKLVAVLMAAFPTHKAGAATAQVYEEMLGDLDYALANAAVRRLIHSAKWMPTIAEIRESALHVDTGAVRAGGEAWGDVIAAVRKFGVYRRPVFADPIVQHAVSSLGWEEICNSEMQAADRARFIELYDRVSATHRKEMQLPEQLRRVQPLRELRSLPSGDEQPVLTGAPATLEDWEAVKARLLGGES